MIQNKSKFNLKNVFMKWLLFYLIYLSFKPALGQNRDPDRLYAHVDKSFYVTGEILNFKVYIFNEDQSISELIHADFVSSTGDVIGEELLKIENNTAFGSFEIPLALKDGLYFLRIYSAWNSNFSEDFNFYKSIPVFNDFKNMSDPIPINSAIDYSYDLSVFNNNSLGISVLNKDTIHTRDSVYLEFRLLNGQTGKNISNLSVAVLDLDKCGLQDADFIHTWFNQLKMNPHLKNEIMYQPEKLIHIEGKILDPDTKLPISSRVLSLYDIELSKFSRFISTDGEFSFDMPLFIGSRSLQIINMNPYQSPVNIVSTKRISKTLLTETDDAHFTDSDQINHYIYHSGLRRKINELFRKTDIDTSRYHESFYLPFEPDKSYLMEKYQMIKNVEEFIHEAIINTSQIKENGQKKVLLNNSQTKKYFMKSPWMMVDGYFVFNDSLVYNIPFTQLKKIDIYNTNQSILKYFDPIMVQGGIIAVYTKNNYLIDYFRSQPNTLIINGLTPSLKNEKIPSDQYGDQPGIPDFNPMIHWDPYIQIDESNNTHIRFKANDASGYYLIYIEGIDATGKPLSGQKIIEVLP